MPVKKNLIVSLIDDKNAPIVRKGLILTNNK